MRLTIRICCLLTVFTVGYLAGTAQWQSVSPAHAQGTSDVPSDELVKETSAAYSAVRAAKAVLDRDGLYVPATNALNVSAILSGGVDAMADLESGRGVDPETFAALYAGMASDEVAAELDTDERGRLTYKGKVVRMYSVARLKQMFQARIRFSGEEEDAAAAGF